MMFSYEDEIICPYCKHKFTDSWEFNGEDGRIIQCEDCEKQFLLGVDFDVTYSATKIKERV